MSYSGRLDDRHDSSESSSGGSASFPPHVAPLRWLSLLASDANEADLNITIARPIPSLFGVNEIPKDLNTDPLRLFPAADLAGNDNGSLIEEDSPSIMPMLQSPLLKDFADLNPYEVSLFRHFVEDISAWIELMDPHKYFSTMVPHLAMHNQGLMKSILALSSRHLSIKPSAAGTLPVTNRTSAVQYYYESLQYLQQAMRDSSFLRSDELLATALIISTYEMIDGESQGWERHLKGLFWIQRSLDINGECGGLRQAIWWAWLRQDVWAAFRERRKVLSFFTPVKSYQAMDAWERAARSTYWLAQCVSYASEQEIAAGTDNVAVRMLRADYLFGKLDEWYHNLTPHFDALPSCAAAGTVFRPIWIHPPAFGAAIQCYHLARILLLSHRPTSGNPDERTARETLSLEAIDTICGLALTMTDVAATLSSTQCLFGAGLHTHEAAKREEIIDMLKAHQDRTGWPVNDLGDDLRAQWARER